MVYSGQVVGKFVNDNTRIFDYMEAMNCENGQQVRITFVPISVFTKADGEIRNPFEYTYSMYVMCHHAHGSRCGSSEGRYR